MMKKRLPVVACVVALGGTLLMAPSASAALGTINCLVGTNVVQFHPGLTFENQHVAILGRGQYTACVSTDPAITSGQSTIAGSGILNCLTSDGGTVEHITWNTGATSTIRYTFGVIVQPGGEAVAVVTGTVTEGKFKDSTVVSPGALLTTSPQACAGPPGVQEIGGPVTLSLVSL